MKKRTLSAPNFLNAHGPISYVPQVVAWPMAAFCLLSIDLDAGGGGGSLAGEAPRAEQAGREKKKDETAPATTDTKDQGKSRDGKRVLLGHLLCDLPLPLNHTKSSAKIYIPEQCFWT